MPLTGSGDAYSADDPVTYLRTLAAISASDGCWTGDFDTSTTMSSESESALVRRLVDRTPVAPNVEKLALRASAQDRLHVVSLRDVGHGHVGDKDRTGPVALSFMSAP